MPFTGRARATAEYLGGSRIRYTWKCGATSTRDHSKGPIPKRLGAAACEMHGRYWSAKAGGVSVACPKHGRFCDGPEKT